MKIRNLDANGDFTFGKGLQNYLTGQAAIKEDIATYLKLWVGNCFWALQAGVNYRQLLDKNQKLNLLSAIQAAILGRFGVTGIKQLDATLNPHTRALRVSYDVATIYTNSFQDSVTLGAPGA